MGDTAVNKLGRLVFIGWRGTDKKARRCLICDLNTKKVKSCSESEALSIMKKSRIYGLKAENGELKGSNGSLDRYGTEGKQLKAVILKAYTDSKGESCGYDTIFQNGERRKLSKDDVIKLASNGCLANGKLVPVSGEKKGARYIISSINGEYEHERMQDTAKQKKAADTKTVEQKQPQKQEKQAAARAKAVKQEPVKQPEPKLPIKYGIINKRLCDVNTGKEVMPDEVNDIILEDEAKVIVTGRDIGGKKAGIIIWDKSEMHKMHTSCMYTSWKIEDLAEFDGIVLNTVPNTDNTNSCTLIMEKNTVRFQGSHNEKMKYMELEWVETDRDGVKVGFISTDGGKDPHADIAVNVYDRGREKKALLIRDVTMIGRDADTNEVCMLEEDGAGLIGAAKDGDAIDISIGLKQYSLTFAYGYNKIVESITSIEGIGQHGDCVNIGVRACDADYVIGVDGLNSSDPDVWVKDVYVGFKEHEVGVATRIA